MITSLLHMLLFPLSTTTPLCTFFLSPVPESSSNPDLIYHIQCEHISFGVSMYCIHPDELYHLPYLAPFQLFLTFFSTTYHQTWNLDDVAFDSNTKVESSQETRTIASIIMTCISIGTWLLCQMLYKYNVNVKEIYIIIITHYAQLMLSLFLSLVQVQVLFSSFPFSQSTFFSLAVNWDGMWMC